MRSSSFHIYPLIRFIKATLLINQSIRFAIINSSDISPWIRDQRCDLMAYIANGSDGELGKKGEWEIEVDL